MSKDPKFETISNSQKVQRVSSVEWPVRMNSPRHPTLDPRLCRQARAGMTGRRRYGSLPAPAYSVVLPPKISDGRSRGSSCRNGPQPLSSFLKLASRPPLGPGIRNQSQEFPYFRLTQQFMIGYASSKKGRSRPFHSVRISICIPKEGEAKWSARSTRSYEEES